MPHLAFGTPRKLPRAEALSGRVGVLDIAFAGVGGRSGSFETVLIAGNVRKWRGRLVGHDLNRVRSLVHESRERLFTRRGVKVDVLG